LVFDGGGKMRTLVAIATGTWLLLAAGNVTAQSSLFLCSGGPNNGLACDSDDACFQSCPSSFGACVVVQGVCDGGEVDGFPCDCPGGQCVGSGTSGTCSGGSFDGDACNPTAGEGGCSTGTACVGTAQICQSGPIKAFGCLRASHCEQGPCVATGLFCDAGDFEDYSCVDDDDCANAGAGSCRIPVFNCGGGCTGDCNGDVAVTIDEIVVMVNLALAGSPAGPSCAVGDADGDGMIAINEIVSAVNAALNGC
jgi:hypothetical protein